MNLKPDADAMTEFFALLSKMSETPVGTVLVIALLAFIILAGVGVIYLIRSMRAGDQESNQITRELIKFAAEVSHGTNEIRTTNQALADLLMKHDTAANTRNDKLESVILKGFRDSEVHYTTFAAQLDDQSTSIEKAIGDLKTSLDTQFCTVIAQLDVLTKAANSASDTKAEIEKLRQDIFERLEDLEHQTGEHPAVIPLDDEDADKPPLERTA